MIISLVKKMFEMIPTHKLLRYLPQRGQKNASWNIGSKAYILLKRKTTCVGPSRWFRPPTRPFCFGVTNMLVLKKPRGPNVRHNEANTSHNHPTHDPMRADGIYSLHLVFALAM